MKITMKVTYADGSAVETAATTADLVAFEREFNRSVARLESELRLTDVCWLAWRSMTRQAKTAADFDTWLDTVDGVELTNAEDPVPLGQAASISN